MSDLNETNQDLIDIVVDMKDKDDDLTLSELVGKGVPFKKVRALLKKIQEAQGLIFTKEDRDSKAVELLSGFEVSVETTAEAVQEQVENLMGELNIKIGMARGYVKNMFDDEDLAMPKVVRAAATPRVSTPGFNGDAALVSNYLVDNKDCTRDEFQAFMEENGKAVTKTGADKVGRWWNVLVDLKVFAEKYCG